MLDKVLVLMAMLGLVVFCGIIIGFVAEPDLAITILLVLALASYDFWVNVFRPQTGLKRADKDLESRYQGVSGKTLQTAKENSRKKKPAGKKR